ncbi:NAD(+) diphosphatase [Quadrisphaera sp. DSM 44207]|uniref:NAD(+) diphosphatase n=1 Tax=Quadrisphaera sp. DSM 44207 TaxID=1881057 RepID=UPI00088CF09F|nr:NAD(+) diphosphatase [Quadrisphaera sp. DSM 44207]SDQ72540.1 NAD+ diphosphatase [Quadrisphaera sp. DSM 44207]
MTLPGLSLSRTAVDRRGNDRADQGLLDRLWDDPGTRVLRTSAGRTPVLPGPSPRLDLVPPAAVGPALVRALLGTGPDGTTYLAAEVDLPAPDPGAGDEWQDLRVLGALLDDTETGLLTAAVALMNWHAVHPRCPRCGAATDVESAGWVRRCPQDASQHFPRTDPAVIMAVVDDEDRLLLGHNPAWPPRRYSTLAGFVEPGESLEAAVRREVLEEVGVAVGEVTYLGNQPWPFPASLMLAFSGRALDARVRTDEVEITDARWFAREELAGAVEDGSVLLPPGVSIARRMIEHWYGGPLAGDGAWR